jgi:CheY-like chemotaxis protein
MVYPNVMSIVRPLTDTVRKSNNSNIPVVEKSAISLDANSVLHSDWDFYGTLTMRISTLPYWNRFAHVYPVPHVFAPQHRSTKGSFGHDQNHPINNYPGQTPSNGILGVPDNALESAEKISINVLLVDNDEDILFTFKSILEAEGYHVESFTDPNEALSHFVQMDPSYYKLVLTDIRMPNINGFQLYQKLRAINSDIKVLFMTAFDVPVDLNDTMPNVKDSDIIKKPIEEEHFVNRIKNAINLE